MKKRNKIIIAVSSVVAIAAAVAVGLSVLSSDGTATSLSFDFIEEIKTRLSSSGTNFMVVEIAPEKEKSEMPFLVAGKEPIKDYPQQAVDSGAATPAARKAFVDNKIQPYLNSGLISTQPQSSSLTTAAISGFTPYTEHVPWEDQPYVVADTYKPLNTGVEQEEKNVVGVIEYNAANGEYSKDGLYQIAGHNYFDFGEFQKASYGHYDLVTPGSGTASWSQRNKTLTLSMTDASYSAGTTRSSFSTKGMLTASDHSGYYIDLRDITDSLASTYSFKATITTSSDANKKGGYEFFVYGYDEDWNIVDITGGGSTKYYRRYAAMGANATKTETFTVYDTARINVRYISFSFGVISYGTTIKNPSVTFSDVTFTHDDETRNANQEIAYLEYGDVYTTGENLFDFNQWATSKSAQLNRDDGFLNLDFSAEAISVGATLTDKNSNGTLTYYDTFTLYQFGSDFYKMPVKKNTVYYFDFNVSNFSAGSDGNGRFQVHVFRQDGTFECLYGNENGRYSIAIDTLESTQIAFRVGVTTSAGAYADYSAISFYTPDNIFDFDEWAATGSNASVNPDGIYVYDAENKEITIGSSPSRNDTYTLYGTGSNMHRMYVRPNTEYTVSYKVKNSVGRHQFHVFAYYLNQPGGGFVEILNNYGSPNSDIYAEGDGTYTFTFNSGNYDYVNLRVGTCSSDSAMATFYDIQVYAKVHPKNVYYYNMLFAPYRMHNSDGELLRPVEGTAFYTKENIEVDGETVEIYVYAGTSGSDFYLDLEETYYVTTGGISAPSDHFDPVNSPYHAVSAGWEDLEDNSGYFVSRECIYTYVGKGKGTYNFIPDTEADNASKQTLVTSKVFYEMNYVSNDWFRYFVLDCTNPEADNFDFGVDIVTITPAEYAADKEKYEGYITSADLIVVNYGTGSYITTWPEELSDAIINVTTNSLTPFMIDYKMYSDSSAADKSAYRKFYKLYTDTNDGTAAPGVHSNNYFFQREVVGSGITSIVNSKMHSNVFAEAQYSNKTKPYFEVYDGIQFENEVREDNDIPALYFSNVTEFTSIRQIIDYEGSRARNKKEEIWVLDVEPYSSKATISPERVANWFPELSFPLDKIHIDCMTCPEFTALNEDLAEIYDMIYIGASLVNMNMRSSTNDDMATLGIAAGFGQTVVRNGVTYTGQIPDYNDNNMDGLYYSNIGDLFYGVPNKYYDPSRDYNGLFKSPYAHTPLGILGGLLERDYGESEFHSCYVVYPPCNPNLYEHWWDYLNPWNWIQSIDNLLRAASTYEEQMSDFYTPVRGSGNDLNKTKMKQLVEFAKAGRPVILSDQLTNYAYDDTLGILLTCGNSLGYYPNSRIPRADNDNVEKFNNMNTTLTACIYHYQGTNPNDYNAYTPYTLPDGVVATYHFLWNGSQFATVNTTSTNPRVTVNINNNMVSAPDLNGRGILRCYATFSFKKAVYNGLKDVQVPSNTIDVYNRITYQLYILCPGYTYYNGQPIGGDSDYQWVDVTMLYDPVTGSFYNNSTGMRNRIAEGGYNWNNPSRIGVTLSGLPQNSTFGRVANDSVSFVEWRTQKWYGTAEIDDEYMEHRIGEYDGSCYCKVRVYRNGDNLCSGGNDEAHRIGTNGSDYNGQNNGLEDGRSYCEHYYFVVNTNYSHIKVDGSFEIAERAVDNSSYMYEALTTSLRSEKSFMYDLYTLETKNNNKTDKRRLLAAVNKTNPKIVFDDPSLQAGYLVDDSGNYVVQTAGEDNTQYLVTAYSNEYTTNDTNRVISFSFKIENPTEPDFTNTRYKIQFLLDTNSDGKFTTADANDSDNENVTDYAIFTEVEGSTRRNIKPNEFKTYTEYNPYHYEVKVSLSENALGVIPWKIIINKIDTDSGQIRDDVHASRVGYARIKVAPGDESQKRVLKVLQVLGGNQTAEYKRGEFHYMENNQEKVRPANSYDGNKYVGSMLRSPAFVNLTVNGAMQPIDEHSATPVVRNGDGEIIPNAFVNPLGQDLDGYEFEDFWLVVLVTNINTLNSMDNNPTQLANLMSWPDMLLTGFGDDYCSGIHAPAAKAIADFIDSGRGVVYTHDATDLHNDIFHKKDDKVFDGVYLNYYVRGKVGLDRYGITYSLLENCESGYAVENAGHSTSDSNKPYHYGYRDNIYNTRLNKNDFLNKGYTVAYRPRSNRTSLKTWYDQDVSVVQGYTNHSIVRWFHTLYYNEHGINYLLPNDNAESTDYELPIFKTWSMVELLKNPTGWESFLEDLKSPVKEFKENDHYFTSKVTQVNRGQITSYPFNINTYSVASDTKVPTAAGVYNRATQNIPVTHEQYYQLNMNADDVTVWYCLAGGENKEGQPKKYYTAINNDVYNSYYAYTVKNVTYTGAGHSNEFNDFEAKLFANLIVSAYSIAEAKPAVWYTDPDGTALTSDDMLVTVDDEDGAVVGNRNAYFTLNDNGHIGGKNRIEMSYSIPGTDIQGAIDVTHDVSFTNVTTGEATMWNNLLNGAIYKFTIPQSVLKYLSQGNEDGKGYDTIKISISIVYYDNTGDYRSDAASLNVRKIDMMDLS